MSTAEPLKFEALVPIGENSYGWKFAVGLCSGRWLCLALGKLKSGGVFCHVFAEGSEGFDLGLVDRDRAIRLTLRGKLDDFRCALCGAVGCDGRECEADLDYDEN